MAKRPMKCGMGTRAWTAVAALAVLAAWHLNRPARGQPGGRPTSRGSGTSGVLAVSRQGMPEGTALYQRFCLRCHGADGTGRESRYRLSAIPDFTSLSWQSRRSDHQLRVSVVDGRGGGMPGFRDRLSDSEVAGLLAYVRALGPEWKASAAALDDEFQTRFQQLDDELADLKKQFWELARPRNGRRHAPTRD